MAVKIPRNEHGQIRVFATPLPLPQEAIRKTPDGMLAMLGAPLNPDFVDIVKIDDLGGMALTRYIQEGYDMAPDLVDAAVVDQIKGYAVLVLSRATGGVETELHPGFSLRHITTYAPTPEMTPQEKLPAKGAKGTIPPPETAPAQSKARISGMLAFLSLITLFAIVAVMILIGG